MPSQAEIAGFIAFFFGIFAFGVHLAEFVVDIGISGDSGSDVDADGCGIDEFYLGNAFCRNVGDVVWLFFVGEEGFEGGDETFEDQGCFSGA